MHRKMKLGLVLLVLPIGLVVFWGCGEREMPEPPPGPVGVLLAPSQQLGIERPNILREMTYKEAMVKTNSRTLLKLRTHELVILPNALEQDTTVSICLPYPDYLILDLEPSGLKFDPNKPAKLCFCYQDVDLGHIAAKDLVVYRWVDGESGMWERLDGVVNTQRQMVEVDLQHFSRYALASR